jgi:uncharacterized protein YecT (DUF1311 family)
MKTALRAAAAAALLVLGPAAALLTLGTVEADEISEEDPCRDPQTTREMRRCGEHRLETTDRELNRLYSLLAAKLDGNRTEKLVAAQRAWITFRDEKAAYEASIMEGGRMEAVLYTASQASTTRERIKDLERYLEEVGAQGRRLFPGWDYRRQFFPCVEGWSFVEHPGR